MAYFVFNPQTNELDSSDNPTPIRKNLGQKLLTKQIPQYGSPDTYGESFFEEDMPNMPDLLREEGIKIGEQVKNNNGERVGFQDGTEILPPTQRDFPGKKFYQEKDSTYSEGRKRIKTPEYEAWLKTQIRAGETEVVNLYKKLQKILDRNPTVTEMQSYSKGGKMSLDKIYKYTKKNNLELSQPRKRHGTKAEQEASTIKKRTNLLKKTSSPYVERLINGNKKVNLHHMNSKRFNVNLNNLAYVPANVNSGALMKADNTIEGLYDQREKILAERKPNWENKLKDINAKGEKVLNKLPQSARGLINFQIVEAAPSSPNGLKISNKGIDWTLSIGAGEGEMGKINFNELTKDQRNKIVSIAKNKFKYAAPSGATTALGTAGGMGVALGAVAAGAEYQAGKPWYDVFVNLPIEFASFGMIPATEISQQLRIRNDLKAKGLSLAERNKKMNLYNRGKSQKAIEQDVGDVGLESYALSGLKEGETMDQANAVRKAEDIELMKRKIKRGYDPNTGKWKSEKFVNEVEFAEGGIVPRVEYRDGSMLGDSRGWEKMLDMSDPNVLAMIAARKAEADRKDFEDRQQANAEGYKHKSEYKDDKPFGIIPAYQADVMKKSFGTKEGLKMTAGALGKGVVETAEWMVEIVPHVFKELHKKGMMPYQSKEDMEKYLKDNNNQMNWMDLLSSDLSWGDKTGLTKMSDDGLKGLTERFGKGNVPKGVKSVQFGAELAGMIADPFVLYAALPRAAKAATAAKFKAFKEAKNADQVDLAKRDFMKVLGVGGVMAAMGKLVPDLFAGKKIKDAAQAAKVVKTLDGIQGGMPEFIPQFLYKVMKGKGTLKSLPDRNFVEGASYQVMLPVKRKYYTSTNKDRGIHTDPDGNPITSRGKKDYWGAKGGHTETRIEKVPVNIEVMNDGGFHISWKGTNNFGDDIDRSMYYRPGETGTQNYAADEFGQGISKEEVVITEPEFSYTEPDFSSTTPDSPNPDSELFLDPANDADEIVEAMEEYVKNMTQKDKIEAINNLKFHNRTDEHFGDATGTQSSDGDWIEGENNMPIYMPRKKKSMGGVASGPPPQSGPQPNGLPSIQPGAIYNRWIK